MPLGDAYSMSIDIRLYNTGTSIAQFRDMVLRSAKSFKSCNEKLNCEDVENSALPSVLEESDGDQKNEDQSSQKGLNDRAKKTETGKLYINFSLLSIPLFKAIG